MIYPKTYALTDKEFDGLQEESGWRKYCGPPPSYQKRCPNFHCPGSCHCGGYEKWKRYYLSGIPETYMRIDWHDPENLSTTQPDVYETINRGVEKLDKIIQRGRGFYLSSSGYATGKTTSATHLLKEAAKLDYRAYFWHWKTRLDDFIEDPAFKQFVLSVPILAIDDVVAPFSVSGDDRQGAFYSEILETVIRARDGLSTIVTSNLTWERFEDVYSASHSVLSESGLVVEFDNIEDDRTGRGKQRNSDAFFDLDDVPPIT